MAILAKAQKRHEGKSERGGGANCLVQTNSFDEASKSERPVIQFRSLKFPLRQQHNFSISLQQTCTLDLFLQTFGTPAYRKLPPTGPISDWKSFKLILTQFHFIGSWFWPITTRTVRLFLGLSTAVYYYVIIQDDERSDFQPRIPLKG